MPITHFIYIVFSILLENEENREIFLQKEIEKLYEHKLFDKNKS